MKKKGIALLITMLLGLTCFLAACAPKEFTFTLTFYNDVEGTDVLDTLTVERQKTLDPTEKVPHNDDEEMVFEGWYLDKYCSDEYEFSEYDFSATTRNLSVYPKWVKKGSVGIVYDLLSNDTYKVSGIGSFGGNELVIPETYDGKDVTVIGTNAFENCSQLTKVTLPNTIKHIMGGAFAGCDKIRSFVLSDSLTLSYIGDDAFAGCDNIVFYTSSSDSDENILHGWGNWNTLNRPVYYDVNVVYENKIKDEENGTIKVDYEYILTNNVVASDDSEENEDAEGDNTDTQQNDYHIYFTRYVGSEEEVEIPLTFYTHEGNMAVGENATLHIGQFAFDDTDVKIVFPTIDGQTGGIGELDDYAFAGYLGESIDIPASVTAVGRNVFYDTAAQFDIENMGLNSLGNYFFAGYKGDKIQIPADVVTLGQYVFSDATSEIEFAEDNKITRFGTYSFANYAGESLVVPASVTEIDRFAFAGATANVSLANAKLANNTIVRHSFINYEGKNITFPENLTTIEERAFYNSSKLETLNIPASVTTIGNDAFYGADSLTEITVADANGSFSATDGVLYSKDGKTLILYPAAKEDDSFIVPESVTAIAPNAFRNAKLSSVTLSENLTSIGDSAFENCDDLAFILIPAKVTAMGDNVFKGCSSLRIAVESATIPTGWKNYNPDAREVTFNSQGVISDKTNGFEYLQVSNGLAIISYTGNETTLNIEKYDNKDIVEIGPGAFRNTKVETITLPNTVMAIGAYAFQNSSLANITASGVTTIGAYAFEGTKITEITMSALESIGVGAFMNSALAKIEYSNKLEELADSVFEGTAFTSFEVKSGIKTLGDRVFAGNTSLESIVISPEVESIGRGILTGCTSVKTVSIGFIGNNAKSTDRLNTYLFGLSSGVQKIELTLTGTSYTSLPREWLSGSDNLTKVTLPATVNEISGSAFSNCPALSEVVFLGDVTRIQNRAFSSCEQLQTIDLSKTTFIGEEAFKDCSSLNNLTLTEALVSVNGANPLNASAFANCKSLTAITIPATIKNIPERCFSGCESLVSVTFSGSINSLGVRAFENCSALTELNLRFEADNGTISANAFTSCGSKESETKISISGALSTLPSYSFEGFLGTEVTLSSNFVTLDKYAFRDSINLATVNAPGVTSINDHAFDGCLALQTFDMSKVTSISEYAFYSCESLDNITLSNNINSATLPIYTFAGCSSLKTVNLGTKIDTIGHHAFLDCSSLKQIDISNITAINGYAFMNCTNLQEMRLTSQIATLGGYAFNGCTKLIVRVDMTRGDAGNRWGTGASGYWSVGARFIFQGEQNENLYVDDNGVVYERELIDGNYSDYFVLVAFAGSGTLDIPETVQQRKVTAIGANAFAGVDGFTSITLPASVTEIRDSAFAGCVDLVSVNARGVTSLGVGVFSDCVKLNSIELGALGFIPERTFENCEAFTTINIKVGSEEDHPFTVGADAFANVKAQITFDGDNIVLNEYAMRNYKGEKFDLAKITEIGRYAFSGSTAEIVFKDGETTVQPYMFAGYMGTHIELPETITTIGASAFANCSDLRELTIPSTVTEISAKAFENLTTSITFSNPTIQKIGDSAFSGYLGKNISIPTTVTALGASVFENAKNFRTLTIPSSVTSIGDNAFAGCSTLTTVNIEGNLKDLGAGAFANCIRLTSITFNGTDLTEIKERTFYNCEWLTEVNLPSSIKTLGQSAFYACVSLSTIALPENLETINDEAFNLCSRLTTIHIPAKVNKIGEKVFVNCAWLSSIDVDDNNNTYSDVDGVLYYANETELICYPAAKTGESYDVLDWVTKIHTYAFAYNTSLTKVYISDKVTEVGSKAFFGCVNVEIYCAYVSKPATFASDWNYCIGNNNQTDYCSVTWAYKKN